MNGTRFTEMSSKVELRRNGVLIGPEAGSSSSEAGSSSSLHEQTVVGVYAGAPALSFSESCPSNASVLTSSFVVEDPSTDNTLSLRYILRMQSAILVNDSLLLRIPPFVSIPCSSSVSVLSHAAGTFTEIGAGEAPGVLRINATSPVAANALISITVVVRSPS